MSQVAAGICKVPVQVSVCAFKYVSVTMDSGKVVLFCSLKFLCPYPYHTAVEGDSWAGGREERRPGKETDRVSLSAS
jgi:hypothetical protein